VARARWDHRTVTLELLLLVGNSVTESQLRFERLDVDIRLLAASV